MTTTNQPEQDRLAAAVQAHRAGRVREALSIYESMLRGGPDDADVLQLMGVAHGQLGHHESAARLLARSLELRPDRPSVLLNLARALREVGREEEALRCCDRALAIDGSLAEAYRTRATALTALGRREEALASYAQAVRIAPANAAAIADLGVALEAAGRERDAFGCFAQAVALDPRLAAAHHNHGLLAARFGQHVIALKSFERAIELEPHNAAAHNNRGNALRELGRLADAVQSYTLALAIDPGNLETLHNRAAVNSLLGQYGEALRDCDEVLARRGEHGPELIGRGTALIGLGRPAEALPPLRRAIELLPRDVKAHVQLGLALSRLEHHADALASFDRALALDPNLPEVLVNRGIELVALDQPEEAVVSFERALALGGAPADTYTNLGIVLRMLKRFEEAAVSFERTLARKPDDPAARFALAFTRLTMGDLKRGLPLYEARLEEPGFADAGRDFAVPRWDGKQSLADKALLVHAEQGLGDAIHFCRYLRRLAAQGATVVFEVMPQLKALMGSLALMRPFALTGSSARVDTPESAGSARDESRRPGRILIRARGEPLPRVDYHCPLLSLPWVLGTDLDTIPADVPYLAAEPDRVERWRERLRALPGLRVGIAWQGNPTVERLVWARGRSMPLEALAPLARIPGVSLISLQKGPGAEQLLAASFRERVLDLGPTFDAGPDAFLDTAAVLETLDLVISTDTSVVHLAGALARPTWLVLAAVPEWRWLLERSDSPWYPTMRLFRQGRRGDWRGVVSALAQALSALAGERANRLVS